MNTVSFNRLSPSTDSCRIPPGPPSFSRSRAVSGLAVTRGSAFSTSRVLDATPYLHPNQVAITSESLECSVIGVSRCARLTKQPPSGFARVRSYSGGARGHRQAGLAWRKA
jgi:hypothetical protein